MRQTIGKASQTEFINTEKLNRLNLVLGSIGLDSQKPLIRQGLQEQIFKIEKKLNVLSIIGVLSTQDVETVKSFFKNGDNALKQELRNISRKVQVFNELEAEPVFPNFNFSDAKNFQLLQSFGHSSDNLNSQKIYSAILSTLQILEQYQILGIVSQQDVNNFASTLCATEPQTQDVLQVRDIAAQVSFSTHLIANNYSGEKANQNFKVFQDRLINLKIPLAYKLAFNTSGTKIDSYLIQAEKAAKYIRRLAIQKKITKEQASILLQSFRPGFIVDEVQKTLLIDAENALIALAPSSVQQHSTPTPVTTPQQSQQSTVQPPTDALTVEAIPPDTVVQPARQAPKQAQAVNRPSVTTPQQTATQAQTVRPAKPPQATTQLAAKPAQPQATIEIALPYIATLQNSIRSYNKKAQTVIDLFKKLAQYKEEYPQLNSKFTKLDFSLLQPFEGKVTEQNFDQLSQTYSQEKLALYSKVLDGQLNTINAQLKPIEFAIKKQQVLNTLNKYYKIFNIKAPSELAKKLKTGKNGRVEVTDGFNIQEFKHTLTVGEGEQQRRREVRVTLADILNNPQAALNKLTALANNQEFKNMQGLAVKYDDYFKVLQTKSKMVLGLLERISPLMGASGEEDTQLAQLKSALETISFQIFSSPVTVANLQVAIDFFRQHNIRNKRSLELVTEIERQINDFENKKKLNEQEQVLALAKLKKNLEGELAFELPADILSKINNLSEKVNKPDPNVLPPKTGNWWDLQRLIDLFRGATILAEHKAGCKKYDSLLLNLSSARVDYNQLYVKFNASNTLDEATKLKTEITDKKAEISALLDELALLKFRLTGQTGQSPFPWLL